MMSLLANLVRMRSSPQGIARGLEPSRHCGLPGRENVVVMTISPQHLMHLQTRYPGNSDTVRPCACWWRWKWILSATRQLAASLISSPTLIFIDFYCIAAPSFPRFSSSKTKPITTVFSTAPGNLLAYARSICRSRFWTSSVLWYELCPVTQVIHMNTS